MEMPREFYDMVCSDIKRIEEHGRLSPTEQFKLHRELDGRYQVCIRGWHMGLWGASPDGASFNYGIIDDEPFSIRDNLEMMKAKLETYKYQMNAISLPKPQETNITVNNAVNISLSFEETKRKIEDMAALNREQTDEILAKIDELQKISKENIPRKSKWEKVKPIISFAADKGADVAIAILSLVLQMKLGGTG